MTVLAPPSLYAYFHDGVRLVQVIGFTKNGDCLVEDVKTELTLELPTSELNDSGVWKAVGNGPSA